MMFSCYGVGDKEKFGSELLGGNGSDERRMAEEYNERVGYPLRNWPSGMRCLRMALTIVKGDFRTKRLRTQVTRRMPLTTLIVQRPECSARSSPGGDPTSSTCGRGKLLHLDAVNRRRSALS